MPDYQPPCDVLQVLQRIQFEEALEPTDPRRVDTREARGSQKTLGRLERKLGLLMESGRFLPLTQKHILFFGHVGTGKTTELKFYAAELKNTGWFLPVEVDVPGVLDRNNLQYADLLMAMAHALLQTLEQEGVALPNEGIKEIETWFAEKVATRGELKEFTSEIKAGGEASAGVPLLAKLFVNFSSAFKANATYKEELRRVIRNTFSQLAEAFNRLIRSAEATLEEKNGKSPVRVLFVIDGTDKLRAEDRRRLFVDDTELLIAVDTLAIYTAPIALKYEDALVGRLDADLVLPMIKLQDAHGLRCEPGWRAMREILLKRADRSLFADEQDIERLIENSGGHPREMLRLLQLCCEFAGLKIDAQVVEESIAQLASEYRRLLQPDDYKRLVQIDRNPLDVGNDEAVRRLLYCLALLEYNDGSWRRSHPVIRTLAGYQAADAAATEA
ncbi:MAG: ATP-binding protein [Janthinobacterium lividum]